MKAHENANKLEFLWPNTLTEKGRVLAKKEGVVAAICIAGQYFINLDKVFQKIDAGYESFEFDKIVYIAIVLLMLFLAWRISRWGWLSAIFVCLWAGFEFAMTLFVFKQPPVWNFVVIYIAFHGVRGCLEQRNFEKRLQAGKGE